MFTGRLLAPPREICAECVAAMQAHWLMQFTLYCHHHPHVLAVRSRSANEWQILRSVPPRSAARRLEACRVAVLSTAAELHMPIEDLERLVQREYQTARAIAASDEMIARWRNRKGVEHVA